MGARGPGQIIGETENATTGGPYIADVTPDNALQVTNIAGLITEAYDFIDVDYTSGNPTLITYKSGGAGGTTVATLTITYTADGCVDTVTKA